MTSQSIVQDYDIQLSPQINNISMTKIEDEVYQDIVILSTQKKTRPIKKNIKKDEEKQNKGKVKRQTKEKLWSYIHQLEYFYASIAFSLENSYYNLSWQIWKKNRFYIYVANHLTTLFGPEGQKNANQCKSKDQNLKKKYYQVEYKKDLLQISEQLLKIQIVRLEKKKLLALNQERKKQLYLDSERCKRYRDVLEKVNEFNEKKDERKKYQKELKYLMDYHQTSENIHSLSILPHTKP